MAQGFAAEAIGVLDGLVNPAGKLDGRVVGGKLRRFRAVLDLSLATTAKNVADTNVLTRLPRGYVFAYGVLTSSVTLATSTVAIGNATTPGKYRAAAVSTAVDAPALFGPAAVIDDPALTDYEDVIMTNAVAALPGAGIVVVDIFASGR
jgi:hypothetical protein